MSTITITNRNTLTVTGVEKVRAVNPTQIVLDIDGKTLCIMGENFEVKTLDLDNKNFAVVGVINSLKYNEPKLGFFKRIFK